MLTVSSLDAYFIAAFLYVFVFVSFKYLSSSQLLVCVLVVFVSSFGLPLAVIMI